MSLPDKSSKKKTSKFKEQLLEIPVRESVSVGSLSYLDDLDSSSDGDLFKKKNSMKKYAKHQDQKFRLSQQENKPARNSLMMGKRKIQTQANIIRKAHETSLSTNKSSEGSRFPPEIPASVRNMYISDSAFFIYQSKFRKRCFNLRRRMIKSQMNYCCITLTFGFGIMVCFVLSLLLMFNKYYAINFQTFSSTQIPIRKEDLHDYSTMFIPLIVLIATYIGVLCYCIFTLCLDVGNTGGMTVPNRDSLGHFLEQIIIASALLAMLF